MAFYLTLILQTQIFTSGVVEVFGDYTLAVGDVMEALWLHSKIFFGQMCDNLWFEWLGFWGYFELTSTKMLNPKVKEKRNVWSNQETFTVINVNYNLNPKPNPKLPPRKPDLKPNPNSRAQTQAQTHNVIPNPNAKLKPNPKL